MHGRNRVEGGIGKIKLAGIHLTQRLDVIEIVVLHPLARLFQHVLAEIDAGHFEVWFVKWEGQARTDTHLKQATGPVRVHITNRALASDVGDCAKSSVINRRPTRV